MMRRTFFAGGDPRFVVIALLLVVAALLVYYRHAPSESPEEAPVRSSLVSPGAARMRVIIDTTAKLLGAQKKSMAFRQSVDSGRTVPEASIGVPASFDELRLITALADSLRPAGCGVAAQKSLKEKTTTIRISDRDHMSLYRVILYRKELSH